MGTLETLVGMEKEYQYFEDLFIWNTSMQMCYRIYEAMANCKDYGLRNQMEKSAVSIPSNISEGYELGSDKGFIRHLHISKGSCAELRTQLYIAVNRKYISAEQGDQLIDQAKKISSMIQLFIAERRKRMLKNVIKSIISFIFW